MFSFFTKIVVFILISIYSLQAYSDFDLAEYEHWSYSQGYADNRVCTGGSFNLCAQGIGNFWVKFTWTAIHLNQTDDGSLDKYILLHSNWDTPSIMKYSDEIEQDGLSLSKDTLSTIDFSSTGGINQFKIYAVTSMRNYIGSHKLTLEMGKDGNLIVRNEKYRYAQIMKPIKWIFDSKIDNLPKDQASALIFKIINRVEKIMDTTPNITNEQIDFFYAIIDYVHRKYQNINN